MKLPLRLIPCLITASVIAFICLLDLLPRFAPKFDIIQRFEWITYDMRVRHAAAQSSAVVTNLGFVCITDDSIAAVSDGSLGYQYGLYWPRQIYGRMVKELSNEGAKTVAFDVLFGELRPDHGNVALPDGTEISSDEFFARQLKSASNVVLAATAGVVPPESFRSNCLTLGDISAVKDGDGVLRRAKAFRDYRIWHPLLDRIAREAGFDLGKCEVTGNRLTFHLPDRRTFAQSLTNDVLSLNDLVVNLTGEKPTTSLPAVKPYEMRRTWQLGIVLAAQELEADLANAVVETDDIVISGKKGTRKIPTDRDGFFYINWAIVPSHPALTVEPIESLLQKYNDRAEGKTPESAWRDKLVVVGSTATGNDLTDLGATPLEKETFLVSKHWNIANAILTQTFIRRSSPFVDVILIVLTAMLAALLTWKLRAIAGAIWGVVAMGGYIILSGWLFSTYRLWIPVVLPVGGAMAVTYVALVTWRSLYEQKQRRRVKSVFSKMVSPNIVSELLRQEKLSLGGARRKMTVFFADVRGFTQLTDINHLKAVEYVRESKMSTEKAEAFFDEKARQTLETVNAYLSAVSNVIKKHNGTLDKYIGDCVMAVWGAPTANEQHALYAVRAAIEAQRAIFELNERRAVENEKREVENLARAQTGEPPLDLLPLLALGTGINSGEAIAGLMGSEEHLFAYTVFGREVNLASRLESVSGRSRIIISESTFQEVKRDDPKLAATCVELPPVEVKGIRGAVKIYEVPWK